MLTTLLRAGLGVYAGLIFISTADARSELPVVELTTMTVATLHGSAPAAPAGDLRLLPAGDGTPGWHDDMFMFLFDRATHEHPLIWA